MNHVFDDYNNIVGSVLNTANMIKCTVICVQTIIRLPNTHAVKCGCTFSHQTHLLVLNRALYYHDGIVERTLGLLNAANMVHCDRR